MPLLTPKELQEVQTFKLPIVEALYAHELVGSRSMARRLIYSGAVSVNGEVVRNIEAEVYANDELCIRRKLVT